MLRVPVASVLPQTPSHRISLLPITAHLAAPVSLAQAPCKCRLSLGVSRAPTRTGLHHPGRTNNASLCPSYDLKSLKQSASKRAQARTRLAPANHAAARVAEPAPWSHSACKSTVLPAPPTLSAVSRCMLKFGGVDVADPRDGIPQEPKHSSTSQMRSLVPLSPELDLYQGGSRPFSQPVHVSTEMHEKIDQA